MASAGSLDWYDAKAPISPADAKLPAPPGQQSAAAAPNSPGAAAKAQSTATKPAEVDSADAAAGWDLDADVDIAAQESPPPENGSGGGQTGTAPIASLPPGASPELIAQVQALLAAEGPAALERVVQSVSDGKGSASARAESPPARERHTRVLSAFEVEKSVEGAVKAKEHLAQASLSRAREEVLLKRKAAQERLAAEEKELKLEETRLAKMQEEIMKGSDDERLRIEKLRGLLEESNRDINRIERDAAAKKTAMARAVDAYTAAEEQLASKRENRRKLNEEMTDLILSTGKAKDEKLNKVLCEV